MPDSAALGKLRSELRAEVPAGVAALDDVHLDALATTLHEAVVAQQKALEDAVDNGLTFLPTLLRRTVMKVLFR